MYSSVAEAEYQFRRAKAEEEARNAYGRSVHAEPSELPEAKEVGSGGVLSSLISGKGGGLLSRIREDDILLLGLLFLLLNENKDDDPLILIILAVLLFT